MALGPKQLPPLNIAFNRDYSIRLNGGTIGALVAILQERPHREVAGLMETIFWQIREQTPVNEGGFVVEPDKRAN